uniref:Probable intron-encoded endonuclease 1 n=1 Tax=Wickerhamomyces canadensis TaxID=1156965 RepID=IEND1_WICCA|nr:endonuclease homologue protein [Wickerhamomyces canadensis]Q34807.2 RecName: Full=Probable intron-encoded endonuclease 1 [Wickerhamomyces canadensis]6X1J_A Chain A, Probable intron-encoded endonuclease 1 [Wickerhamomyces canadensis]BAA06580.2 endonuclease homologue protein [Wickerhamomyces canadensis]
MMKKQIINKKDLLGLGPNSKLIKDYKKQWTTLSKIQEETLIGNILGDVYIKKLKRNKHFLLQFEWKNKAYIEHIVRVFDEYVISPPTLYERKNHLGNKVITWRAQTFEHKAFDKLGYYFMENHKKIIKPDLVLNYITERSLAYWFMDDGGKWDYNKKTKNKSLVLHTQGFKKEEVEILINDLNIKFNLNCSIKFNKNKPIIYIPNKDYELFYNLVNPYIIPEMKYKLLFNV